MEKTIQIYCSHAQASRSSQQVTHSLYAGLRYQERSGQLDFWHKGKILAGAQREAEIEQHIAQADIVLLIVDVDYVSSDECYDFELPRIMQRYEAERLTVIPIMVDSVGWKDSPFGMLEPLPPGGKPIRLWSSASAAYTKILQELQLNLGMLRSQSPFLSSVTDNFFCLCAYPQDGFHWDANFALAPGLESSESTYTAPWLASRPLGVSDPALLYSPFEEKELVRRFAHLPLTQEAIKEFADTHGFLDTPIFLYHPHKTGEADSVLWVGESFTFWCDAIRELKMLVELWEMIHKQQEEQLERHIKWKEQPRGVLFEWSTAFAWIASEHLSHSEVLHRWKFGEVFEPALYYLCKRVNKHLEGHANISVLPFNKEPLGIFPDSLLSAIYTLFIMEIKDYLLQRQKHGE